jgi:hypothetical protein
MGGVKVTNVVELAPRADDQPSSADHSELLLIRAISHIAHLTKHVASQSERISALEARVPVPPLEIPAHWVVPKVAAYLTGYSRQSIYRFFRNRDAQGIERDGSIFIDPDSLPKKGSRRRRK